MRSPVRGKLGQKIHARAVLGSCPVARHARIARPKRKDQHAALVRMLDDRRSSRFGFVEARPCGPDAHRAQRLDGLRQPAVTPVQHMIVRERAAVDSRRGQARHVGGVHAVMDVLARPSVLSGGDGRFQIDNPRLRKHMLKFRQRIAPDVGEVDRPHDRPRDLFGDLHVAQRRSHVGLVEIWLARVREDLIDPAPGHDVATQEQRHVGRFRSRAFGGREHRLGPRVGFGRGARRVRRKTHEQCLAGLSEESASIHGPWTLSDDRCASGRGTA